MSGATAPIRPFLFESGPFAPLIPLGRDGIKLALIPAGATLLLYLFCLPTGIPGEHAGEFVIAAHRYGIPHSPGFPLWCLSASLFKSLSGSSPVWGVSLWSALLASLSCGLLTLWLRQQDIGRRASVFGGLFLGVGLGAWGEAVVPGGNTLNLFLILCLWVILYQWLATGNLRWIPGFTFVLGLGLLHQLSFWGPAALALALVLIRKSAPPLRSRVWLAAMATFVVSLLPVLYLPWRARSIPYLNSGNPQDLAAVARHLWGVPPTEDWFAVSPADTAMAVLREHFWLGVPLALLGFWTLARRHRGDAWVLFLLFFLPTLTMVFLGERHGGPASLSASSLFLPAYAIVSALAAFALDALLQSHGIEARPRAHVLTAITAALPLLLIVVHTPKNDYSNYRYADEYAQAVLETLPKNALLITGGGVETYPLLYRQSVLGERPDVVIIDRCGSVEWSRLAQPPEFPDDKSSFAEAIPQLLERDTRPIYATRVFRLDDFGWESVGLVYRAGSLGGPRLFAESDRAWQVIRFEHLPPNAGTEEELGARGAPLDATAKRIAAVYYGALARRHSREQEFEERDRAAKLAHTLLAERLD